MKKLIVLTTLVVAICHVPSTAFAGFDITATECFKALGAATCQNSAALNAKASCEDEFGIGCSGSPACETKSRNAINALWNTLPAKCSDCPAGQIRCGGKCVPRPVCGNGVLECGEDCDDGNTADGDGCSATCKAEQKVFDAYQGKDVLKSELKGCPSPSSEKDKQCVCPDGSVILYPATCKVKKPIAKPGKQVWAPYYMELVDESDPRASEGCPEGTLEVIPKGEKMSVCLCGSAIKSPEECPTCEECSNIPLLILVILCVLILGAAITFLVLWRKSVKSV